MHITLFQRLCRARALAPLLLAGCVATSAHAQELELELALGAQRVVLGEPITVEITLRNAGSAPTPVYPLFEPTYGFARYTITPPGGTAAPFRPAWLDEGIASPTELAPGASISGFARLYWGAEGATFDRPGRWSVEAELRGVRSAPLAFEIEPVPAEFDAAAQDLLSREALQYLYLEGGEHLAAGRAALERVTRDFPGSPHAAYADLALGLAASRPARDFETGRARPADLDRAAARLERALGADLPAPYAIRCHAARVEMYERFDRPEEARQALEAFERRFGDDRRARSVLEDARAKIR